MEEMAEVIVVTDDNDDDMFEEVEIDLRVESPEPPAEEPEDNEVRVLLVDTSSEKQEILTCELQPHSGLTDIIEGDSIEPAQESEFEKFPEENDREDVLDNKKIETKSSQVSQEEISFIRAPPDINRISLDVFMTSEDNEYKESSSSAVVLDDTSSVEEIPENRNEEVLSESIKSELRESGILTIYPPPPAKGGIPIYKRDYECLADQEFLNDIIIDFYLLYLKNNVLSDQDQQRAHIFSSHFYTRLSSSQFTEDVNGSLAEQRYATVQRWTKNVNVFTKDFIIIPINKSSHWFLAIICYPYLVGTFGKNSCYEFENEFRKPCILLFDSLYDTIRMSVANRLKEYLQCEYLVKMKEFKSFSELEVVKVKAPKQSNATDCGLYTLQYVENFFKVPIKNYKLPFRNLENWFVEDVINNKREEIANLISNLAKEFNGNESIDLPDICFSKKRVELASELYPNDEDNKSKWKTVRISRTEASNLPKLYTRIKDNDSSEFSKSRLKSKGNFKIESDSSEFSQTKLKSRKPLKKTVPVVDSDSTEFTQSKLKIRKPLKKTVPVIDSDSSDDATVPLYFKKSDKLFPKRKGSPTSDDESEMFSSLEKKVPCYRQSVYISDDVPVYSEKHNTSNLSPPYYLPKTETSSRNIEVSQMDLLPTQNEPPKNSVVKKRLLNSQSEMRSRGGKMLRLALSSTEVASPSKHFFPQLPTFDVSRSAFSSQIRKTALQNQTFTSKPPDLFYSFQINDCKVSNSSPILKSLKIKKRTNKLVDDQ